MNIDAYYIIPALGAVAALLIRNGIVKYLARPKVILPSPKEIKSVWLRTPAGWVELEIKKDSK